MSGDHHQTMCDESDSIWEDGDDPENCGDSNYYSHVRKKSAELIDFETQRSEIEQRTLSSTHRSMRLLNEAEECGIATTEELDRQREKLENTNRQLDDINRELTFTQRHLNGMKSMFGSLRNVFQREPQRREIADKPDGLNRVTMPSALKESDVEFGSRPTQLRSTKSHIDDVSTEKSYLQQLDQNLDVMNDNISRLKGIGIAITTEIKTQNEILDVMSSKVDDVNCKLESQQNDMKRILDK